MKNKSIWEEELPKEVDRKPLKKETDILIIGAGMAGLSTAFFLKDSDQKIMIIDKGSVGEGVSSKTTGKLTYLQGSIYQKLCKIYGVETSKLYYQSQKEAIDIVRDNVKKYEIDCDLQRNTSYLFTEGESKDKINKEEEALKKMDIPYSFAYELPLKFPCTYAICIKDSYVFHPLKYLKALSKICKEKGVIIQEGICATEIVKEEDTYVIETDHGSIRAKKVVICTHYPFFVIPSFIPLKSHIERSYITAFPLNHNKKMNAITTDSSHHTLRYYKDFFIFGGENHRMSVKTDYEKNYETLLCSQEKYFTEKPMYMWSTHDIITEDYLPYIGYASKEDHNILLATGFNKWGMTNGTIAGKVLADLILKGKSPYETLLCPYRSYNLSRIKEAITNALSTSKIFAQTKLIRNPAFYKQNVRVYKKDGIYYGEYKDDQGNLHTVYNKCPHMGCSLLWNAEDLTWDCPCHGSRYTMDGDLLEGPSTKGIAIKKETTTE